METLLMICLGVGLSAACGFRVFVPLLIVSIAANSGHVTLASGFEWIGSTPALILFSTATALEIGAYYVPWLDNLLDTIATPAAVVAGTLVTTAMLVDMSPVMSWSLGLIAGGGAALTVQGGTVLVRGASSLTTGGLANPIVSTVETSASVALSILAIAVPIVAALAVIAIFALAARWLLRRRTRRDEARAMMTQTTIPQNTPPICDPPITR